MATKARDTAWEDLNYDERTDKLATLVTKMYQETEALRRRVNELEQDIRLHEHDKDGRVYKKTGIGERESYGDSYPSPGIPGQYHPSTHPRRLNPLNITALTKTLDDPEEDTNY